MARNSNSFAVVAGCLVLALLLWGYVTLTRVYEADLTIPLVVQAPANQALLSSVPTTVSARIRGSGLQIINLMFFSRSSACTLNLSNMPLTNSMYFVTSNDIIRNISTPQSIRTLSVNPSELQLATGDVVVKRVPVQLRTNITFRSGFEFSGGLQANPSTVEVRGSEKIVNSITSWPTNRLGMSDIHEPISTEINLSDTLQTLVYTQPNVVRVNIDAQQTADVVINDVPVFIAGAEQGAYVCQPKFVRLTVRGGIDRLSSLLPENFRAEVTTIPASGLAKPTITAPELVRVVGIEPAIIQVKRR